MELVQLIIIAFVVVVIGGVFLGPMANTIYGVNHKIAYSQTTNTSSTDYVNYTYPERIYDPAEFNNSQSSEQMNFTANTATTRYLSLPNSSAINNYTITSFWTNESNAPRNTNWTLTIGGQIVKSMCYQETATTQASCEVYYGY